MSNEDRFIQTGHDDNGNAKMVVFEDGKETCLILTPKEAITAACGLLTICVALENQPEILSRKV